MELNGIGYHVEQYGEGEPLLLLHGFTGSADTWRPLIPVWQDFRLIAVDLIGHGRTEAPKSADRYRMEQAAADLTALLDELGIEKANVLGYSMGGRLALSFAIWHPHRIRRLVLESSSPGLKTEAERRARQEADEALAHMIERNGVRAFVDHWEQLPLFATQKRLPEPVRAAIRRERLRHTEQGLANSLRGMGTGVQPSWWERLREIQAPVLLLCGEHDEKFCRMAADMHEQLANSELICVQEAGHAIHVEQFGIFAKIVSEFIKKGEV
ncbi:2-succinyl-6-hydroxy-2,4-cyclohexadiene-1-carboxylate synthase [Geobacillus sp. 46C-IIa]|uniref:2-succinyl-6-hydroxy-2, 4-cyclohexadiene-1-carboxylate synthase n=1 Tax=Geobacillus sp. 46C-IIa TaxID=1963025 RepID=UPI0009C0E688|nr:2-succinyl-6-hydroxy-2,4-cyclohexadiene-1-carboxylate synthase [Geobacillus sp. 46C-IIa]OQP06434.1 2-succinyl-6-hydroxy-2,4-cyclohexadiene-1-carboxylate synthase [Geobacillus sp. 46C-IIa]